jgi:hypothetical protein
MDLALHNLQNQGDRSSKRNLISDTTLIEELLKGQETDQSRRECIAQSHTSASFEIESILRRAPLPSVALLGATFNVGGSEILW